MIPVTTMQGRRVAVFGLGGSGLATARALIAGGASVLADDDNAARRDAAAAAGIPVAPLRDADWDGLDALVLAPGVPLTHPEPHWSVTCAQAAGVEVVGDIELFCRERRALGAASTFVAITGTNGKSTTTALVGHVLAAAGRNAQVGGNIGTAILDLEPPVAGTCHVIECSSYQIDLAPGLEPTIGVLLNVTPDHLDRHGSFANYAAIKERLVTASATAVIGVDDAVGSGVADRLARAGKPTTAISIAAPVEDGIFFRAPFLMSAAGGTETRLADLGGIRSLRGAHNAQNAAAAFAACRAAGLGDAEIAAGLASFPGLAHRMEEIGKIGHVLFVNDSKATNADAAERALASFERIYWLAGGRRKEGGVTALVGYGPKIAAAYLFGEAEAEFAETLAGHCPVRACGTLANATRAAFEEARRDAAREPVVLLSPACASFDQFTSFEARGEAFRGLVAALGQDVAATGDAR